MEPRIGLYDWSLLRSIIVDQMREEKWTIYVGNLSKRMTWLGIVKMFSKFGLVTKCVYPVKQRGGFMGFALISYRDQAGAYRAVVSCNGRVHNGYRLCVAASFAIARPLPWACELYVTNFSLFVDEVVLGRVFGRMGATGLKIRWSAYGYRYATIMFDTPGVTRRVLEELNGVEFGDGYRLRLTYTSDAGNCAPVSPGQFRREQLMRRDGGFVRIVNLPETVDEWQLSAMFEGFGPIAYVLILRAFEQSTGCGIIRYAEVQCACEAVSVMDGTRRNGKRIRVKQLTEDKFGGHWAM
ncbi:polyadenylate-binding protein 7-like isoform X2 [Anopheles stephensi]|uniref:polyadenylate-binding protein 7-like isoform X2 n=1 Tax=Anopheles stephensi TaxID=30069 RepID=UPI001658A168|nr:polyadenylate-binding protein 7-like isoform X2 [Anopheles stephensi]